MHAGFEIGSIKSGSQLMCVILTFYTHMWSSGCKEVVSDSPGLVDFAIRLVIFVLNLPDGQVLFFG